MMKERIEKLIKKMSVEEKVAQLGSFGRENDLLFEKGRFSYKKAKRKIGKGIGQLSHITRDMVPKEAALLHNEIQKFAIEKTRLGIPIIIHDECLHGCMAKSSTSFPQAIGLASTWDDELLRRVAIVIGKETKSRGIHQCLSPTINIARDPRCGRTEETYGEDTYLTSSMAVAFIKGIQSQKVVATPKHFTANFVGDGGRDSYSVHFSERLLREVYFPPFKSAIQKGGALSIMAAYNSLDGIPCSCNRWLLTKILREEWGFDGFVVSDYGSVEEIKTLHKIASSKGEAAKKAVEAGLDMELPSLNYFNELVILVKEGKIKKKVIDEAVKRILEVKEWLGLFDDPFVDPDYAVRIANTEEHRNLALRAAEESIVLLKNDGVLPLSKGIRRVAVIGPSAHEVRLGGYSTSNIKVITPLEGIQRKLRNKEVYFAKGCEIKGDSREGFEEARRIAEKSEVAILFMGNSKETEGENRDRCNLDLPGVQEDLILEICNTGIPVIVVLINGSAITMKRWIDKVNAVVEAWYPGEEGGNAIANVLFGDYNPSGKLPITFPQFTGQLPLYYNPKPSGRIYDYVDLRGKQELFPFGYGLSYTNFRYKNLRITPERINPAQSVKVSVEVENVGKYEGKEVVQLYLRDIVSSLSTPIRQLKGFRKVNLKVGERKKVEFILGFEELSFLDENLEPIVEPGEFEIVIGKLKGKFKVR